MAAVPPAAGASLPIPLDSSQHSHHSSQTCSLRPSARASSPISVSTFGDSSFLRTSSSHGHSGFRSDFSLTSVYEVSVDGSANAAPLADLKLESHTSDEKEVESINKTDATPETSVSSFMTEVANLVKLVDSRDIVELELKHLNYEIVIRKKEALAHPPSHHSQSFPPHQVIAQAPYPTYITPSPPPSSAPSDAAPDRAPSPTSAAPAPTPASEYPSMLSPMAGTFYRSPAPGEPAFVKVGDKVQKGQMVCIVEAMKLMNEIEADQSGTIVDILAEDGKPVSIDTPLFLIKP